MDPRTSTSSLITDKGLSHLKNLSHLRALDLSHTHITDQGLDELKKIHQTMSQLKTLDLSFTKITDSGLVFLKYFNLKNLNLESTDITDLGLKVINDFKSGLHKLNLNQVCVTDEGLKKFKKNNPHLELSFLREYHIHPSNHFFMLDVTLDQVSPESLKRLSSVPFQLKLKIVQANDSDLSNLICDFLISKPSSFNFSVIF